MNAEIKELQREIKEKDSQMETLSHRKDMLISEMETQCQDLRSKNEQEQMHLREQVSKLERDVEEANSALDERKRAVETLKVYIVIDYTIY
jgi:predicted RNase H-like nuclease (RuvC/YqgF family)